MSRARVSWADSDAHALGRKVGRQLADAPAYGDANWVEDIIAGHQRAADGLDTSDPWCRAYSVGYLAGHAERIGGAS